MRSPPSLLFGLLVAMFLVVTTAGVGVAGISTVTVAPIGKAVDWKADRDGDPKRYRAADVTLTLSSQAGKSPSDNPSPTIEAVSPLGRTRHVAPAGFSQAETTFAVQRLDPQAKGPAVMLTSYTGGAHCCTKLDILDPLPSGWRYVDGGQWDGAPASVAKDVDGDGVPDIVVNDDRFDYAFACYACGGAPSKVFNVIDGVFTDVSTAPRYRPLYRREMARAQGACFTTSDSRNGMCAVYVADAIRLGDFDRAWGEMLKHYQRNVDWALPTGCNVARIKPEEAVLGVLGNCPKGHEITYKTYPEALRNFLHETGYLQAS